MTPTPEQHRVILAAARRASYRYFFRPQPADVEDLAQEVTLKVLLHQSDFDPRKALWTTWVQTIAEHTAIDMGKKKRPLQLSKGFDIPAGAVQADETLERRACGVRRLIDKAPLRTRVVLAALNPELFPPCEQVKEAFRKLFNISWETSREREEWMEPTAEFLAAAAGARKNTLVDQPLCRLRAMLS
jgi:hypothetical protein